MFQKCSQKAPNLAPEEGKAKPLFASYSCLGHLWEPTWCQDLSQEALGAVLGRFWDRFGHIYGAFWMHFRERFGIVWLYLYFLCLNFFAGTVYKHELKRHGGGVSRQALGYYIILYYVYLYIYICYV